ncbi:MAG: GspE/PulE family protein, partial [Phycisphaerae bacterium]
MATKTGAPRIEELKGRPLGRVLVKMARITRAQVHEALDIQQKRGGPIGQILLDLGHIDEKTRSLALAYQAGMEYVDLDEIELTDNVLEQIPANMANSYKVIPIEYDESRKHLTVAVSSPDNFRAADDLRTLMGYNVTVKVTDPQQLEEVLTTHYGAQEDSLGELINEIAGDEQLAMLEGRGESIDLDTVREASESNPVKRLVNMVLLEAIRNRASDIHFEPFEDEFKMRYRI